MKESVGNLEIVGLIPAAGYGKRLYPFSKAVPKELYPILGKPVIEYCLENFSDVGIKKTYIIVGHQKGAIMDYVGDGTHFDIKVSYLHQCRRDGLASALLAAESWINNTFVVLLGDSFIEPSTEIRELLDNHNKRKPICSLLLFEVSDPSHYGVVKFKSEVSKDTYIELSDAVEKPDASLARNFVYNNKYYAICGLYIFEPKIYFYLSKIKDKKDNNITDAIRLAIEGGESVFGKVLNGRYLDMGKWDTLLRVEKSAVETVDLSKRIQDRELLRKRFGSVEE